MAPFAYLIASPLFLLLFMSAVGFHQANLLEVRDQSHMGRNAADLNWSVL